MKASLGQRWSRIFKADPKAEVNDELAFHIEQRERDYVARGMDAETARKAALERLGDLESIQRECTALLTAERRAEARRDLMKFSLLDFKLGLRMLVKYPALTLVGGIAIAFATAVGAATFELVNQITHPDLGLQDGDRIVAIQTMDAQTGRQERKLLSDFGRWRSELNSIEQLGAYRNVERNLVTPDRSAAPIPVAEITATGFSLPGVRPLLGRPLRPEDERPGAPAVLVIGESLWRLRFQSDAGVIGTNVRLGNTTATIVGVMPEAFGFPVSHSAWVPLQLDAAAFKPREGPAIHVFGRLAPGVSLERATAELDAAGKRAAASTPATHEHLVPRVVAYPKSIIPISWAALTGIAYSINLGVLLFLVLVCANVATLVFARAAARESEIVVRNALGASRSRIITQLFAEALVLGAFAATLGLAVGGFGLRWGVSVFEATTESLPFWITPSITPTTGLYTALITVLGALVVGVIPALKVTGSNMQTHLRQGAVAGGGVQFGKLWTGIIVTQIAITVVFVAMVLSGARDIRGAQTVEVGFPTQEYLSVRLGVDAESPAGVTTEADRRDRLRTSYTELERRLESHSAVSGVTFAALLPRMDHPQRRIEVDGGPQPADTIAGRRVSSARVALDYLNVVGSTVLAGRTFTSSDLAADSRAVVVNTSFVDKFLGGRNAVGRRVRYLEPARDDEASISNARPGEWYEIVGVVNDLGMTVGDPGEGAGVYHPAEAGDVYPAHVAVHVKGDPRAFMQELREIAVMTDPALRLNDLRPLNENQRELMITYWFWFRVGLIAAALVLVLSLAGIYSIMSFTVSRRTREIGIRVALGADRKRIVFAVFAKALLQIGSGIAIGALILITLAGVPTPKVALFLVAYILVMTGICSLACIVPTRRALRIQPTDAMRAADA